MLGQGIREMRCQRDEVLWEMRCWLDKVLAGQGVGWTRC